MPDAEFTPKNLISSAPGRDTTVRAHWEREDEVAEYEEESPVDSLDFDVPEPSDVESAAGSGGGQDFVHLHVHSEYSLLDGLSSVGQLVRETKRLGMGALALTDHGNLYGALDFYSAAKDAGIKPILGVEAYVSPRGMTDRDGAQDRAYYHLVLLARDIAGYRNLLKLVTRANLEGYYYKPRIDRALLAEHAEGLIALSGCYSGEPSRAILDNNPARARQAASWYREIFGENYFLELQDHGNPDDQVVNRGLLEIHRELAIPVVATNDLHYALPSQAEAHDVLLCVQTNSTVTDEKRMRMQPSVFYLRGPREMWELFGEVPSALTNTLDIASRCDLKLQFDRLNFPSLDHLVPAGQSPLEFLVRTCRERLPARYEDRLTEGHRQRLEYELEVIDKTGFAAYILFVWDFVEWARRRGIMCGPRGSAAGSIILYCLGVSDVDPIGYGLTFERFLNPERIQMPDIDMDFPDDRREEVIQYVVNQYGRERVAQIITFGRLQARAAIRDVGRALGYPISETDRVAKLIPALPLGLRIEQAVEQNPELKRAYEDDPAVTRLINAARTVEGVTRHAGTHAAGVVVSDEPLVNYVPLQKPSRGEGQMTQFSMKGLEKIGLLKMDFLGLANLTMLAKALEYIEQTTGERLDLVNGIPYDDAATYHLLGRGETKTVFQLEGSGMTRYIQELKPSTVDHLAAMVALYRPGPMAHIPAYIARREGREAAIPPHPALEEVLRESYGIIVYQDQVLQVVREVAGYSLGQADVLRRAMGKKEKQVMAEEGPKFIKAALANDYQRDTAEHLWELLQPFAGYAFNKAHAYCYAFLAYQTAYLKANYPVEWFAAVLTTVAQDTDKVVGVIAECRRLGVKVLEPSINRGQPHFAVEPLADPAAASPAGQSKRSLGIRYGLCAIKNVGDGAVLHLVEERERGGPYRSLDELCRRVDLHTVNKRVLESLVKSGALDELGRREALLKGLDAATGAAQRDQKAASSGQVSLFDTFGGQSSESNASSSTTHFALPSVPVVPPRERAAWEKEVLGFNFADHPYQEAAPWLRERISHDLSQISPEVANARVTVAGAVTGVRKLFTKNRDNMAVLTLEDLHGKAEVVVFPRAFEKSPALWREDVVLVVEGRVDTRDDRLQLILEKADEWTPPPAGTAPPPLDASIPRPTTPADDVAAVSAPVLAPGTPNGSTPSQNGGHLPGNGVHYPSSNGNGTHAPHPVPTAGAPHGAAPRRLRAILSRERDDQQCIKVLEQLQHYVEQHPGQDELQLFISDRTGSVVELLGARIRLAWSPDAEQQVGSWLGAGQVKVIATSSPGQSQ